MTSDEAATLGGFRRIGIVGNGAQAVVWRAVCERDVHGIVAPGTEVALKIRHEHGDGAEGSWQRLSKRIAELCKMEHRNVVRYLGCFREVGVDGERHVVVQELLDGTTLKERLDAMNKWNPRNVRLGLDADVAKDIMLQVADGLHYTASLGIYHRDVKPGNIFICADGTAKLIDFGVAKQSDGTITEEGNIRGSWNYLAPDFTDGVFRGDEQSDLFSVGVVLHEVLTGRLPYRDTDAEDTAAYFMRWAKGNDVESPLRVFGQTQRLLWGIDKVFDRTLTPNRAARYKDFGEFRSALEALQFIEKKHGDRTYRMVQFVGEGGFGEVFKARWLEADKPVAMKILKDFSGVQSFRKEAETMQSLDDPCFVKFQDYFEDADRAFLVMDFLEGMPGSSLRDAINRARIAARLNGTAAGSSTKTPRTAGIGAGCIPKDLVLAAFERYARALSLMHRHVPMIIHRDIKPSNLYFPEGQPNRIAIMDFGVVRTGDSRTVSGLAPCTYDYAPPEIVTIRDRGGPGMDIFALGLCMYEALTGRMAYPRITEGFSGQAHFYERCRRLTPPTFDDPCVTSDPELLTLLRRMTNPDVSLRLTDAAEVAREIRKIFYRDDAMEDSGTRTFDAETDRTKVIGEDRLMDWFAEFKKANPVDERRLMEMYREEWLKDHENPDKGRTIAIPPKTSPWKTVVASLLCGGAVAVGILYGLPKIIERYFTPPPVLVQAVIPDFDDAEVVCTLDGTNQVVTGDSMVLPPGRHSVVYARSGYEALKANFEASEEEGCVVPSPATLGGWQPLAVRVTVPFRRLDSDVVCYIDHTAESNDYRNLMPGPHSYRYERPGYIPGTNCAFSVEVDSPVTLPVPEKWIPAKVKVAVPAADGVVAKYAGEIVGGEIELAPGNYHTIEYERKVGDVEQSQSQGVYVYVNTPTNFPAPVDADWSPEITQQPPQPSEDQEEIARLQKLREEEEARLRQQELQRTLVAKQREFSATFDALLAFEPLADRRIRLAKAETLLNAALGNQVDVAAGKLYVAGSDEAKAFAERLEAMRKCVVGLVRNECGMQVDIAGTSLWNGQSMRFDFADAAASSKVVVKLYGHDPIALPADFDGTTFVLRKDMFTPSPVKIALPTDMSDDVTCTLDDGTKISGSFEVRPRDANYVCTFQKFGHDDKVRSFRAEIGTNVSIAPLGDWVYSEVEVTVPKLADGIGCRIDDTPVVKSIGRRPGEHVVTYVRAHYNSLSTKFTVDVATPRAAPAPEEIGKWEYARVRAWLPTFPNDVVCYIDGARVDGDYREVTPGRNYAIRYERTGYETQNTNCVFAVGARAYDIPPPERWTFAPVKVSLPSDFPADVTCSFNKVAVTNGFVLIRPRDGAYKCVYERTGYISQTNAVSVSRNTPVTLPRPGAWEKPSAPAPAQPAPSQATTPAAGPATPAAQSEYDEAIEYYGFGSYDEAFSHFYNAAKAGYPFSQDDKVKIKKSFDESVGKINLLIADWKKRGGRADSHRNIEAYERQRNQLIERYNEIKSLL